jgi:hypothetical protein
MLIKFTLINQNLRFTVFTVKTDLKIYASFIMEYIP